MQAAEPNPQLLSLGKKDASRLLEVYVKRSLSLNDGSPVGHKAGIKSRKWVTSQERGVKVRRHSSDSSAHLGLGEVPDEIRALAPPASRPESPFACALEEPVLDDPVPDDPTEQNAPVAPEKKVKKGTKKAKKPSLWKNFLGLFSKKEVEEKAEREPSPERMGAGTPPETPSPSISCLPVPAPFSAGEKEGSPHVDKPLRRKLSVKKFSFRSRSNEIKRPEKPATLQVSGTVPIEGVLSVEPTSTYYEKVSEELERIVKEVKESPTCENHVSFAHCIATARTVAAKDEETIEKIISLLKEQGDNLDLKMRENGTVSSFFRNLSYSSFQQLADRYMQEEIPSRLPQEAGAPELVRFAFTLDFTAKVAGLSNQTISRIMGFGNRYLQDRFTQMSRSNLGVASTKAVQNFNTPD